ncbi:TetR/AcrR family transcriptional regulator [Roseibium suaedae]|uniref:Transcriptional regulator, TetR family n=1 Tax=Roseibium suaedae TaxID=735517 RepID=A0A1M7P892_9HYPH|nr:TetR/AcrR family transcriptional regulator [Roseibium suaedae]SHN12968.1 transcriptional regulator, TetR family [Roseibium suaedae]
MSTTNNSKPRGRPRRFDPQDGIAKAQALFHERGYDAVSVTDVTKALGINPPSFYAAFGSKADLYAQVLDRWSQTGAIPMTEILREDRPVAEALVSLLEDAARRYASGCDGQGCLVIEGTRSNDADARDVACALNTAAEKLIRDYIARRHPEQAGPLTDFVSTTMTGLSAKARNGYSLDQLLGTARLAGTAIDLALGGDTGARVE